MPSPAGAVTRGDGTATLAGGADGAAAPGPDATPGAVAVDGPAAAGAAGNREAQ